MRLKNILSLGALTFLILTSCSESNYKFKLQATAKTTLGKKAAVKFEQLKGEAIDSVLLYVDGKRINTSETSMEFNTNDYGVGKHVVTAIAFYPNKSKKLYRTVEITAPKAPKIYTYTLVNTYPHDKKAYTQGLEYHNGFLYETTGKRGKSTLRKVEIPTGKVLQKLDLDKRYFGEGLTIHNNKIYWLTWQARKGFIYDLESFEKLGKFDYDKSNEGWGLTHNNNEILKSDGSNKIWFLDPNNLKEKKSIQAYTHKSPVNELNELELINGKLFANKWKQNSIVIIDPATGIVEGILDLSELSKLVQAEQRLVDEDEVLNGIAYNPENNHLYVTGKHWGKLFEIKINEQ